MTNPLDAALRLVNEARESGIECRLVGSLAVFFYVGERFALRPIPAKDIDLVSSSKSRRALQSFLKDATWTLDESLLLFSEQRETYRSNESDQTLDVYYDEIDGNHPISIRGRMNTGFPAVSVTDLLLSKLQRVEMRVQDRWDACALVDLGPSAIDLRYFSAILGSDWGLYTTVIDNLEMLEKSDCGTSWLLTAGVSCRKSVSWRLRAMIGRRMRWWKVVYDTRTV